MMEARSREDLVLAILGELAAGFTSVALYGTDHPRSVQAVANLERHLAKLLQSEAQLDLVILGEELFIQERPFTRVSRQAFAVLQRLSRRGVEHVSWRTGVSTQELVAFLQDVVSPDDKPVRSHPHLVVGKVALADEALGGPDEHHARAGKGHVPAVRDRITLLSQVLVEFSTTGSLAISDLLRIVDSILNLLDQQTHPLELAAPWEGEERWPAVHAHNTTCLVLGMAKLAGISPGPLRELGLAALLHDVGKLSAPPEVQQRELQLGGSELELVLDHPMEGATALLRVPNLSPLAVIVALEHHLHYNGGGYPRLPRARRPHPGARLTAVADAFSVLLTARGHLGLATRESSVAFLVERAGTVYDPGVVKALQELILG